MQIVNRAGPRHVALETTLLLHGVPPGHGMPLARELAQIVSDHGALPAFVGVLRGTPVVGLETSELEELFRTQRVPKANSANLGLLMYARSSAATTVSATMELAAAAGVRLFATGGIGGIHRDYATRLDISADLAAFSRFPVAVVSSGVKSILDVLSTREALETLGIPVVGFQTDRFPAFYLRESEAKVDARFDDEAELASFVARELPRTGRGILIANPVPEADAISPSDMHRWLAEATARTAATNPAGRDITPELLNSLHDVSAGATLRCNLALIRANAALAASIVSAANQST
jgi:pseudouridine-5'-phosphate glycosidase